MLKAQKTAAVIALLIIGALALAAHAEPIAVGSAEVDLGPALQPLQEVDAELEAQIAVQGQQIADLTERVAALEGEGPTDPGPDPDPGPIEPRGPYGTQPAPLSYWTRSWALVDLWRISDAWRDDGTAYLYKQGHPPPGNYVLSWSGSGSIRITAGADVFTTMPGYLELRVPADSPGLDFKRSGDVGEVHLVPAGWTAFDSPFNPVFLDRLRGFPVIRFMDWQGTNNNPPARWADRVKPEEPQGTPRGVALELMIDLANELEADPWFCMPHNADDDYVRRFAQLVLDRIDPEAMVYIEYSNEVWNTKFSQAAYLAQGDMYSDGYFQRWAEETRRDFEIWAQVWEGQEDRLVRVLGVQLANVWVADQVLGKLGPGRTIDALAPSAYFGFTTQQRRTMPPGIDAAGLAAILSSNIDTDNTRWYRQHYARAEERGLRLIAYEGGQHADAQGDDSIPWFGALMDLQASPMMRELYHKNLGAFEAAGGDLLMAYHDVGRRDKWGAWGHLEYQDQPTSSAPKFQALIDAREE